MIDAKYETRELFLTFAIWMVEEEVIQEQLQKRSMIPGFEAAIYGLQMSLDPVLQTFTPPQTVSHLLENIVYGTRELLERLVVGGQRNPNHGLGNEIEKKIREKWEALILATAETEVKEAREQLDSNLQQQIATFKAKTKDERGMVRTMPELYKGSLQRFNARKTRVFIASEVGLLTSLLGNPGHFRRADYTALLCEAFGWYYAHISHPDVDLGANLFAHPVVRAYMQDKESGTPVPPIELEIPARALPYIRLRAQMNGKRLLAQIILTKEHHAGMEMRKDADAIEREIDAWIDTQVHNHHHAIQVIS